MSQQQSRLYLGCKKEGCNGVLCIPSRGTRHGSPFQCPRCLNKQKYCLDCQQLYINFRRHRQRGHELYEFQRKRQVLIRNDHGLFIASSEMFLQPSPPFVQTRKPGKKQAVPLKKEPMTDNEEEEEEHEAYYPMMMMDDEDVPSGAESESSHECVSNNSATNVYKREDTKDQEVMDVVEVDDASDILVKLLHSSAGGPAAVGGLHHHQPSSSSQPTKITSWTAQYMTTAKPAGSRA